VALRAARAGAEVTGLDSSSGMVERARRKGEGLGIRWDVGDAQELPYADASFDVVSSNFGVIFAPDRAAAAAELARVCRAGGRLGMTAWRPKPGRDAVYARFRPEPLVSIDEWGDEGEVERLLGGDFELTIEDRLWHLEGETPEEVFEMMAESAPPTKAFLDSLDAETHAAARAALIGYWAEFRQNGGVREPRPYLLILGVRR
jgi:SAM-dependent methyltransferase